mgnify:CR=1 FL=1
MKKIKEKLLYLSFILIMLIIWIPNFTFPIFLAWYYGSFLWLFAYFLVSLSTIQCMLLTRFIIAVYDRLVL